MTIVTENRERFLLAIVAQVPAERIAEVHFLPPIKQGGVESGVAVVVERGADDASRIVVYAARYRLTLKGINRGKWETSIVAEADAPLITVDAVVRGVQRRAGDVDDAARMEGDEVRAIVEAYGARTSTAVVPLTR